MAASVIVYGQKGNYRGGVTPPYRLHGYVSLFMQERSNLVRLVWGRV